MSAKTFRPCVIHVGDNQALSAAVQRELFARGWRWCDRTTEVWLEQPTPWIADATGSGEFERGEDDEVFNSSAPRFDLTTQPLTVLLDYLEKPEEVKVEVTVIGCAAVEIHTVAKYSAGSVLLRFEQAETEFLIEEDEIDALYAASQAARKEGK